MTQPLRQRRWRSLEDLFNFASIVENLLPTAPPSTTILATLPLTLPPPSFCPHIIQQQCRTNQSHLLELERGGGQRRYRSRRRSTPPLPTVFSIARVPSSSPSPPTSPSSRSFPTTSFRRRHFSAVSRLVYTAIVLVVAAASSISSSSYFFTNSFFAEAFLFGNGGGCSCGPPPCPPPPVCPPPLPAPCPCIATAATTQACGPQRAVVRGEKTAQQPRVVQVMGQAGYPIELPSQQQQSYYNGGGEGGAEMMESLMDGGMLRAITTTTWDPLELQAALNGINLNDHQKQLAARQHQRDLEILEKLSSGLADAEFLAQQGTLLSNVPPVFTADGGGGEYSPIGYSKDTSSKPAATLLPTTTKSPAIDYMGSSNQEGARPLLSFSTGHAVAAKARGSSTQLAEHSHPSSSSSGTSSRSMMEIRYSPLPSTTTRAEKESVQHLHDTSYFAGNSNSRTANTSKPSINLTRDEVTLTTGASKFAGGKVLAGGKLLTSSGMESLAALKRQRDAVAKKSHAVGTPDPMRITSIAAGAMAEGEETEITFKCNSLVLKKLMIENINESSSSDSKRLINTAAERKFGGNVDVVCSRGHFSYVFTSSLFCEASKGAVTCIAFRQATAVNSASQFATTTPI